MFEKEAELYALSNYGFRGKNSQRVLTAKIDYQDGAEFGFQKGIKAKLNFTTITDCPIKDEWHYVKDGDLPEEDKSIMIYAKLADGVAVGKRRKQGKVYEWYFATYDGTFCLRDKEVIAWKEIVLPKESE